MSGWTALTLQFKDEQVKEEVDRELCEKYTGREPYTADGYADTTIQVGRFADHKDVAETLAAEYPRATHIAVVSANDTSDSGHGTLFRVTLSNDGSNNEQFDEHPIKQIDRKEGYEGACGSDVTGYFAEKYGVRSYETWEA